MRVRSGSIEAGGERRDAPRVAIIANTSSGSGHESVRRARTIVVEQIAFAGGTLVTRNESASMGAQIERAMASEIDLVIAIGGDGTVNAGAGVAIDRDAPLLILPAGTMNLVAKDLGLGDDAVAVATAADDLLELRIDVATANGELFLHSAVVGVVPAMSEAREAMREASGAIETLRHLGAFIETGLRYEPVDLRLEAEQGGWRARTRSVVVTNNPLAQHAGVSHARDSIDAGCLGVYASAHEGPAAPVRLLAALATGQLEADPETRATTCERLTLRATGDTIPVALDGEVRDLRTPVVFASHPRRLRVAVPRAFAHGVTV